MMVKGSQHGEKDVSSGRRTGRDESKSDFHKTEPFASEKPEPLNLNNPDI